MKKKFLYLFALLAAVVACNKEVLENTNTPSPVLAEGETRICLTGRIVLPTKVEFDDELGRFSWSSSDSVAVHATDGVRDGNIFVAAGYKKGNIVPNPEDPSSFKFYVVMSEAQDRDFYAVYPSSLVDEDNYGNPDLKINLPASYEISPAAMGNYSPTPMIAVNDPSSNSLDFRHVGGLLRIVLYDVSPNTSSIDVSLGKRITGSFTVNNPEDPDTAVPYIVTDDAADVVTFRFSEPLTEYVDGLVINVPVPTGTYESLNVTAKDSSGESIFSYEDSKQRMFDSSRGRHINAIISAVAIPLCFESVDGGSVTFENPIGLTIEYSTDNIFWTSSSDANITISVDAGECVYFRGNNAAYCSLDTSNYSFSQSHFSTDGQFYIYGNIMSLIDAEDFEDQTELTEYLNFVGLFAENEGLINHPTKSLELPATTLTYACYANMFSGCSGLTRAFALPATVLQGACYANMYESTGITRGVEILAEEIPSQACASMYSGCINLVYAPDFHASVVGDMGCSSMFKNCYSLVNAPALPASSVGTSGCASMFNNCIALVTPPAMAVTSVGSSGFENMFKGCLSLTAAPSLSGIDVIPESACAHMFYGCSSLTDVPDLSATTVGENGCQQMFMNCYALTKAPALPVTTLDKYCCSEMFRGCVSLTTAPALPATTLADNCYASMFYGCAALTTPPVIAATEVAPYCCSQMFYDCTSLTTAPSELKATTLAENCYQRMFSGCTSLTEPPVISATTLATSCCSSMFYGCTSLTAAPALPAMTLAPSCYDSMFYGCSSLMTAELPATTLAANCYRSMFRECTSMTTSPVLAAQELVSNCYYYMFYGCSSLNHVTLLCLQNPVRHSGYWLYYDYTTSWLNGTPSTGTFVVHHNCTWYNTTSNRNKSWIPSGWTIVFADE